MTKRLYPVKVRAIRKVPYSGPVHNLAVGEDESYIADGFVVHNCRATIVAVTRLEGPVQYITPAQVARGVELSGKGFQQEEEARGSSDGLGEEGR